jgi:hypothetical protein
MSDPHGSIDLSKKERPPMAYALTPESYVSEDGNYGSGMLLTFAYDQLTEDQWGILDTLADRDRMSYAVAILNGHEDLSEWED